MKEFNYFLFIIFVFLNLAILIYEFRKKDYIFRYPFLASLVMLGWASPQIYGLIYNNLYPDIIWKTILFSSFCLISIFIGYYANKKSIKHFKWKLNLNRLIWLNLILTFVGAYFYHRVNMISEEATQMFGGQWEGIITVYAFFAKLLSISLGVALVIDLYKKSYLNKFIIFFSSYFFIERIILGGRREETVEFFLMILLWFWWKKGRVVSRSLFVGLSIIGVIWINLIGIYRGLPVFGINKFDDFMLKVKMASEIDWVSSFKEFLTQPTTEILNLTLIIDSTEKRLFFDFGTSIWNAFVHSYIPATFLGREFKDGLKLQFPDVVYEVYGHIPHPGSTVTGIADAFQSFWYFGCIKFFLIGYIMSRWYKSTTYSNNIISKMVIMQLYGVSLLAITHTTHHFFLEFIKIAAFLFPMLYLSKISSGTTYANP